MDDDLQFDFEERLEEAGPLKSNDPASQRPPDLPFEAIGQQPGNFKKNYRQTVCTYWLRNLCMKGDQCGFLHEFNQERMPVCRSLQKYGECKDIGCPFKHSMDDVKECNMYKLGFCIYGPHCRFKHVRIAGPPPDPSTVEACKPKEERNLNVVVNQANPTVTFNRQTGPGGRPADRDRMPLALPAPPEAMAAAAMMAGMMPPPGFPGGPMMPPGAFGMHGMPPMAMPGGPQMPFPPPGYY